MLTLLAVAVGIVFAALAHREATIRRFGTVVRLAAAVAGFIVGYLLTWFVASHL